MNAARSILWSVAGLAVAAMIAVLAVTFSVVLAMPASDMPQMTVRDAAAALRGDPSPEMRTQVRQSPPEGRPSGLLALSLAKTLGVEASQVRAAWLETPVAVDAKAAVQTVAVLAGHEAVVEVREGGFLLRSGGAASLDAGTPVPPFAAAVRQRDGQWVTVSPREPLLTPRRVGFILACLGSALLLVPLVLLVARKLTRPIRELADAADRVRLTPGGDPIAVSGPREIQAAAAALNAMHHRLRKESAQRTRIIAAIAHDMRNPLTGLRMRAENVPEPDRSRIIADIDRMSVMIGRALDYARGREAQIPMVPADPAELVANWCAEGENGPGLLSCKSIQRGNRILCSPEELRRAFFNLVDNSVRFAGGAEVLVTREGEEVVIAVADQGPGIDPADVERLLEPFERLEPSRSGTTGGVGLGLAICREIAERHGGHFTLEPRMPKGLIASLRLPAAH
jgi:signal transduction histidine kinase